MWSEKPLRRMKIYESWDVPADIPVQSQDEWRGCLEESLGRYCYVFCSVTGLLDTVKSAKNIRSVIQNILPRPQLP